MLELLRRGWTVLTVDHAPEGIARLRQSVSPVAGHFFGPHDTWSGTPDMTFHTRAEIEAFFAEFEIVRFREQDEDGEAVSGPKHWHVFHVIARKRR